MSTSDATFTTDTADAAMQELVRKISTGRAEIVEIERKLDAEQRRLSTLQEKYQRVLLSSTKDAKDIALDTQVAADRVAALEKLIAQRQGDLSELTLEHNRLSEQVEADRLAKEVADLIDSTNVSAEASIEQIRVGIATVRDAFQTLITHKLPNDMNAHQAVLSCARTFNKALFELFSSTIADMETVFRIAESRASVVYDQDLRSIAGSN
jgi:hypothetical protein